MRGISFKRFYEMNKWWIITAIIGLVIAGGAITGAILTLKSYSIADGLYQKANDEYVVKKNNPYITVNNGDSNKADDNWYKDVEIDLAGVQSQYPGVIGWIYFENEDISYPITYEEGNNNAYLKTAYTGESSTAGSIFLDCGNSPTLTDLNTIIYGHNMKNGKMFGKLKNYRKDENYYNEHKYFRIYTPDAICRYEIFAYEEIPEDHILYSTTGPRKADNEYIIKDIIKNSLKKTDVPVSSSSQIVTLSTCTTDKNKRFIVSAVRVAEHYL